MGYENTIKQTLSLHANKLIFILLFLLIFLGTILSWFTLNKIKDIERKDLANSLETILKITEESIYQWNSSKKAYIETWTISTRLRELTKELLKAIQTREALLSCPATARIHNLFKETLIMHGFIGFFIIAPDFTNIASINEANVGSVNYLESHGNYLEKLFRGIFQVTHPIISDVPLPELLGFLVEDQPMIFICAPIKDETDKVIAGLALLVDPSEDFSQIVNPGHFGETGHTYAFNKNGEIITQINSEILLQKIGLIKPGEQSILKVNVRDPGVNMMKGFRPKLPQNQQPLTRMAGDAVEGRTGLDLNGYRDYRGVPVVGAWTWIEEMNFGLATEIELSEGYRSFYNTRWIVLVGFGMAVGMFLFFSIALAINRRKILNSAQELEQKSIIIKESHDKLEQHHIQLKNTQAQLVQSEKMAGLGTLVAGVAHEINNPINFVNSCSQNLEERLQEFKNFIINLLGENPDKETIQMFEEKFSPIFHNLSAILDGGQRIKTIVTELRTFSSLGEAEHKRSKIVRRLQSTINLVQTNYREQVDFQTDFQADPEVECWPAKLNQVFINMMVNACQAIISKQNQTGDNTPGILKISTRIQDQLIAIRFQDNGSGISEDIQHKLFEPFFTTKEVGEGTGLGLAVSYGIIEKHQGKIDVESSIGKGTTFSIYLPLT